jgi:peroxiredoxin
MLSAVRIRAVALAATLALCIAASSTFAETPRMDANPFGPVDSLAVPSAGDPAPDFPYRAHDGQWRDLSAFLAHGDLLLVIGADDATLARIERERDLLLSTGVVPVAVLAHKSDDVWRLVRRLGLTYSVLADPNREIARLYGTIDPRTGSDVAGWCVVDRKRRVRAAGRGAPNTQGWAALAAGALGRPVPGEAKVTGAD